MEDVINNLLRDFENGHMNRRQLIQGLLLAATAASTASANNAPAQQTSGFKAVSVDHISYQVPDYGRARDFYAELLGMTVASDNGKSQCQLHFGDSLLIARNRPGGNDSGSLVDHMSYKIENWDTDRVRGELERRGLQPRLDRGPGGTYASFHIADPDGYDVQISGELKAGDSLYEGDEHF